MKSVWNSNLSRDIKVSFFQATVESVLLYGCESWTLKETLRKSLDGCYTRMLRAVLNVNWSERVSNERLYGVLPLLSDKVASRRMQFAGHCHRHPELPTGRLVLWETRGLLGSIRTRFHPSGPETRIGSALCFDDVTRVRVGVHPTSSAPRVSVQKWSGNKIPDMTRDYNL